MVEILAFVNLNGAITEVSVSGKCQKNMTGQIACEIVSVCHDDSDCQILLTDRDRQSLVTKLTSAYISNLHPKGDHAHFAE